MKKSDWVKVDFAKLRGGMDKSNEKLINVSAHS